MGGNPALHGDRLIFRGGGLSHYGGTDTPLHSTLSICFLLNIAMKKSSFLDSLRKFVGEKALHFYVNGAPIVKNWKRICLMMNQFSLITQQLGQFSEVRMFEWSWRCSDYQFGIDLLAIFLISLKEEEVELLIKKGICFRHIYRYQYQAKFYSPVLISDKSISLHFRSLVFIIYFGHLKPTWRYP